MNFKSALYTVVLFLSLSPIVLAQSSSKADQAGMSAEVLANYEAYLNQEIEAGKMPGAVSLISRNGVIAHSGAFGFNNMATKEPMTTDKVFYIQSMTKLLCPLHLCNCMNKGLLFK